MSNSTEYRELSHLLTLARRGKSRGASGGEKQARALVLAILDNVIGIDGKATAGIADLIAIVQGSPQTGVELVREKIADQREVAL